MPMEDLQKQLVEIQQRNERVEADKAWETSWVRRGFVTVVTYIFALLWLLIIKSSRPFLAAFVPAIGYLLSTVSLTSIRKLWLSKLD